MSRVLLVDDSEVTAEMVRLRLGHAGHEVERVATGAAALERLRSARPDLVLLETLLPELDGLQLLKEMKRDSVLSSIRVVVLSARAHEDDVLAALAAGADDYVTKPVSLRELVARVERVLAQGPEPVRIAVQPEGGALAVGEVIEANARSTSVRFHREGSPHFAIGDAARLSLSSPALPQAIALGGRVISRGEAEPHRVYGFELLRRSEAEATMTRSYLNLIGRRSAFRVEFPANEEIAVAVRAAGDGAPSELSGRLLDLSIGGVRVRLKADADRSLCALERVEIRFQLPGHETVLAIAAAIRHRVADASGGVTYGMRFEPGRSPEALEQMEQISDFVMTRMG